jgi:hypothetical protein
VAESHQAFHFLQRHVKLHPEMKIKQLVFRVIAFIALIGIFNCVLIEPALAYKDDPVESQNEETHCCFICHSMHHQWLPSETSTVTLDAVSSQGAFWPTVDFHLDPLPASIFHPPLAI